MMFSKCLYLWDVAVSRLRRPCTHGGSGSIMTTDLLATDHSSRHNMETSLT